MRKHVLLAKMLMILTVTGFFSAFSSQSYAQCDITVSMSSPGWGDATTWTLTDASNTPVLSGGPYGNGYSDVQTLTGANNAPYTLTIVSTFGDNTPNYNVSVGVDVLYSGTAPGNQTTVVGPINCPAPPSCDITVNMSSPSWGDATTWTLTDASNTVVLSGGPYGNGYSDTQILAVADNGPYSLNITSSFIDNLPNYSVSVDGNVLFSGIAGAQQTTNVTGITCSSTPPCQIDVDMSSASWGDLTTWTLTDANNNIVLSGGPYGNGYSDSQSVPSAADGPYTLTIVSTSADNSPNYVVSVGGNVVFSGTAPGNQTTTVGPIAPECSTPPTPCEAALPIACGAVVTGTTVGAPTDAVPTCVTTNGTGGKIWYEFIGTGDVVTATTCSALTSYDTKLWVFSGDCNNLTCVTGNDDDFNCVNDIFSSTVEFVSTLGETYYIIVGGFGTSQGNYELSVTCAPVPVIPVCATNINVTTPPCGAGDISITWDAVVDADNYNIYAGTAPGLNDIANPFPLGNFTEVFLINPALNTTYYITVVPSNIAGEALGCVEFNFTSPSACPPPANDDICDATDVTNSIQQDLNTYQFLSTMTCDNNIGNTDNGTPSPVGPSCGAANGNDVWYSFTTPNCAVAGAVPFTIELTTNNPGTAFDTKIALFISDDNTCTGNMTEVICNDDNAFGGNPALCGANPSFVVSAITINTLLPNTQYWVYVGGFNGSTGTYELSGRALAPAHGVAPAGGGTQVQLTTTNMGAALYTYYYKLVGSTGYSTFNSQSALTDTRTLAPGNDYITQVMYRCDADYFNQNQWYRTEPQTITLENTCALVNNMNCTFNGPNSYTLSWPQPSGELFTNNGALSGYRIKRNPVGSSAVFTFSNPAVVCANGTCSVTLPGNSPTGFNWTIETRCSANTVQVGNTTTCGPAPQFEGNNDANNNIDRTSENVFSFVNAETGVEFVDVQMFDAYADFGLNTPIIGDYEMYVNSKNEITWRRVDTAVDMNFDFVIVPNPSNAMTTVHLNTVVEAGTFTIVDAMGRTINSGAISNTDNVNIDAAQLQSGVYMVVVTVGNQQLTRRLVVAN